MGQYEDGLIRREQSRESRPAWPHSPIGVAAGRSNLGLVSAVLQLPCFLTHLGKRFKLLLCTSDSLFCWFVLGDRYSIGYSAAMNWEGGVFLTLPRRSYMTYYMEHCTYQSIDSRGANEARSCIPFGL
ncbi:hypothetical protein ASPTUDRAFT_934643 [Aspergillus tubingensis CBS 134.48]|uniref:Uncharacterized protein n=1 Tax=Aspergillus tubingensis (strain CBS 134.48) TaxID=767770 RepID=A0A1L9MZD1_ASPTC|nr:hypothetical protein ASPTUDRAFT_934643 [Aspergillus tubingensis CBS 134.48]